MSATITKTYSPPVLCENEILRYAGCKTADERTCVLLEDCLKEIKGKLVYKVCYQELALSVTGNLCDFGAFEIRSNDLAKNLAGCERAIIFAATVGLEIDRLIAKYSRLSPSKAVMMQAIGTERIEALCDVFCQDIRQEKQMQLTPRFSAGYGDFAMEAQRDIFALLDCAKRIGVCLNESLLMSPSKSVTAFVGFGHTMYEVNGRKCAVCIKKDCAFRREK